MRRMAIALRREGTAPADLFLDANSTLAFVYDAEAIGHHARQRLMTFEGEWFLDRFAGVPWLSDVLGKMYDPVMAEAVVKAELLDTDGVVDLTSFSTRFSRETRGLDAFNIEVLTIYDQEVRI